MSAVGLFIGFAPFAEWMNLEAFKALNVYLWLTFVSSTLFMSATAVLLQRLRSISRTLQRERRQGAEAAGHDRRRAEHAMKIQHIMAEQVRSAAALATGYDTALFLESVLGSELRGYLRERLGDREFHVTVKAIPPAAGRSGEGYGLIDVFRDADQDRGLRPRREKEPLTANALYREFSTPASTSRWIYVADTETLEMSNTLRERARKRGYRSVLAFPVNMAWSEQKGGKVAISQLVGLLGLDSPTPRAFDALFDLSGGGESPTTLQGDNDSGKRIGSEELNLFYGLADASATILMLNGRVVPRDSSGAVEEASDDATPATN